MTRRNIAAARTLRAVFILSSLFSIFCYATDTVTSAPAIPNAASVAPAVPVASTPATTPASAASQLPPGVSPALNGATTASPPPSVSKPVPVAPVPVAPKGPASQTGSTMANTKAATAKLPSKPLWTELTPAQQQALTPLAVDWDKLDSNRKKKWLLLSAKFATLKPEEQQRMQENMRDWAKLTPEQRRVARESYFRAKKLDPDQKSAKWQQYQKLPEEQKKKLAADAESKKHVSNLPLASGKPKVAQQIKPPVKAPVERAMEKPVAPPVDNNQSIIK
jgi:Protein of unknown function (DUF3106)